MIGIAIITGRLEASFGPRLEEFLNEHNDAEIMTLYTKGIEGGKGMVAVLKYNKKEAPKPKVDKKAIADASKAADELIKAEKAQKELEIATDKAEKIEAKD